MRYFAIDTSNIPTCVSCVHDLLQIVERYDILLIQEIRDKSETSIDILVDAVNADIGLVSDFGCSRPTRFAVLEHFNSFP